LIMENSTGPTAMLNNNPSVIPLSNTSYINTRIKINMLIQF
jgi:hypothetical protein